MQTNSYYYPPYMQKQQNKKRKYLMIGAVVTVLVVLGALVFIFFFSNTSQYPYTAVAGGDIYQCTAVYEMEDKEEDLCVAKPGKLGVYVDEYWKN